MCMLLRFVLIIVSAQFEHLDLHVILNAAFKLNYRYRYMYMYMYM